MTATGFVCRAWGHSTKYSGIYKPEGLVISRRLVHRRIWEEAQAWVEEVDRQAGSGCLSQSGETDQPCSSHVPLRDDLTLLRIQNPSEKGSL